MFDCASIGYVCCDCLIVVCMNPRWGICMPCAPCAYRYVTPYGVGACRVCRVLPICDPLRGRVGLGYVRCYRHVPPDGAGCSLIVPA